MHRILSALILPLFLAAPALAQDKPGLTGTWEGTLKGRAIKVAFEADGHGSCDGRKFFWTLQQGRLTWTEDSDGRVDRYQVKLEGDRLTLSEGDLAAPLILIRAGAGPAKVEGILGVWELRSATEPIRLELGTDGQGTLNGAVVRWTQAAGRLTLTVPASGKSQNYATALDGDRLTLTGDSLPAPVALRRAAPIGADRSLVGRWQNAAGLGFEFKADGTAVNSNGTFQYSAGGGVLYLAAGSSVYSSAYTLDGDRLVLEDGAGQKIELRRVAVDKPFAAAAGGRTIVINGTTLPADTLAALERKYKVRILDGSYWYDARCGAWGLDGGPTAGFIPAGLNIGGEMRANASRGSTGVFINGRELHEQDVTALQQVTPVPRGSFWLDADGNCGTVGNPVPIINLAQAAARNNAGGRSYLRRSSLTGITCGGDGSTSYVMGKDFAVMVGN